MDGAELAAWWEASKRAGRIHAQRIHDRASDLTPAVDYVADAVTDLDDCEPIDLSDDLDAAYEFDTYAELHPDYQQAWKP